MNFKESESEQNNLAKQHNTDKQKQFGNCQQGKHRSYQFSHTYAKTPWLSS